ncbi:NUMOD4 motif-containing HNH endonuclease [Neobacillus sp. NPDC093182]|uniref:NUMOD4 motif-containing HNH endonuclease n=1 Tax=Neobacillus sp. NPDC093182 TaxID=3364297 RepID=UPI0038178AAB
MEQEIWRNIPDYEDYQVSNFGNVLSFKNKKYQHGLPLKVQENRAGYIKIIVWKNGNQKTLKLHRIVCELFNGDAPEGKEQVNHIDGNKRNNDYTNLEWISSSENTLHAYKNGLKNHSRNKRAVVQKTLEGDILNIYPSVSKSAIAVGGNTYGISMACKKKFKSYKGYVWNYVD